MNLNHARHANEAAGSVITLTLVCIILESRDEHAGQGRDTLTRPDSAQFQASGPSLNPLIQYLPITK
ncbi:hypothetical protein SCA6_014428 [Theobroma cacao]